MPPMASTTPSSSLLRAAHRVETRVCGAPLGLGCGRRGLLAFRTAPAPHRPSRPADLPEALEPMPGDTGVMGPGLFARFPRYARTREAP